MSREDGPENLCGDPRLAASPGVRDREAVVDGLGLQRPGHSPGGAP